MYITMGISSFEMMQLIISVLFSPQFDLACPVSICAINLVTVGGWMTRRFSGVGSLISGSFTVLRLDITQCTLVQSCRLCPHFWPITVFEDNFRRSKTASYPCVTARLMC